MIATRLAVRKFTLGIVAAVCCFALSGCEYDVPITSSPTRQVDETLLGDWRIKDGTETMKVRRLDDSIYIVAYSGALFRAYHSDVAGTPFVSAQEIDSSKRHYTYLTWNLSANGKQLDLRIVSDKLIPYGTKDSASVRKLLEQNLQHAELFGKDEGRFTRVE